MKLHAVTHLPDDLPRGPLPRSRRQLEEEAAAAAKRSAPPPGPPPLTSAPQGYRITPQGGIDRVDQPKDLPEMNAPAKLAEQLLPDGINEVGDGCYEARCCRCGEWTELFCDLSELPDAGYEHYCGGSPRCCP